MGVISPVIKGAYGPVLSKRGLLTYDWYWAVDQSVVDRVSAMAITWTRASLGWAFNPSMVLTQAAIDAPRFDHLPNRALGLLPEAASTNSIIRASDLPNAAWTKNNTSIVANVANAADGTLTADRMQHIATAADVRQTTALTPASGVSLSTLVQKGNHQWFRVIVSDGTNSFAVWVDTTNGVKGTSTLVAAGTLTDYGIEDYGDFWRVWAYGDSVGAAAAKALLINAAGDGDSAEVTASFSEVSDTQMELGIPSSIIPTTSAAVTRAKDVATASLAQAEYRLLVEGRTALGSPPSGVEQVLWQADAGANERVRLARNSSNEIHAIVTVGAADVADLNMGAVANDTDLTVDLEVIGGALSATLDAGTPVTSTAAVPTTTDIRPGMDHAAVNHWMGTIKRTRIYAVA